MLSNPYLEYESSSKIYFPVSEKDDRFHPKETVIGLEVNGKFKAYPFSELDKLKGTSLEDNFQGENFKIIYDPEAKSAEIFDAEGNRMPAVIFGLPGMHFILIQKSLNPQIETLKINLF